MRVTRLLILVILSAFITLAATCQSRGIKPEVLIPEGMPIRLDISLDGNERERTKYIIRRTADPEVSYVTMTLLTVGSDNKVDADSSQVVEAMTASEGDTASQAWPRAAAVRRLIVIVKRVETSSGVWVLDSENQQADLQAIVERGLDALPKAKFIEQH